MFIQFLNDQILNLYGLPQRFGKARLANHIRRLLWSASLVSEDPLIIPTVDLVQSPVSDAVLDIVRGLAGVGLIELVGSTTDPDDFVRRKRIHFSDTGLHPEWSRLEASNLLESVRGSLNTRNINTTEDMFDQWSASVTSIADGDALRRSRLMPIAERQLLHAYKRLPTEPSLLGFIDHAYELPRRLGDHAFLWNVVERVDAFRLPTRTEVAVPFERALAYYWAFSHLREYQTALIGHDYLVGWIDCGIRYDSPDRVFDLAIFDRMLKMIGIADLLQPGNVDELLAVKFDPIAIAAISGVLLPWFSDLAGDPGRRDEVLSKLRSVLVSMPVAADRYPDAARRQRVFEQLLATADMGRPDGAMAKGLQFQDQSGRPPDDPARQRTIFIGHGRSLVWMQLRDLLTNRLGLSFEEFNRISVAGLTVTDRLRQMLDASDFAFVILTGEDETAEGVLRARQNVVHELGLFQGRLGFDRAIVLLEEGCEHFSNIAGLQEIRFPRNNLMAMSEEVRRVLEERL